LPNNVSGTEKIMKFIAEDLSADTYISLMSQYLPYYRASQFKDISRRLTEKEYERAKEAMEGCGLSNGWIQESYGLERFAGIHIKPALKKE
jgi:putative pyruvate formate lyase activating enzyme